MASLLFGCTAVSLTLHYFNKKENITEEELNYTCTCTNCAIEENINIKNISEGNLGKNYIYNSSFYKSLSFFIGK